MAGRVVGLAALLAVACAGKSEHTGAAARPVAGAAGMSEVPEGGRSGGGTGGSEGGRAGGAYLPSHPGPPVEGDGQLTGGSFEGSLGSGFDFCRSKYPGAGWADAGAVPPASAGDRYVTFDSTKACADSFGCGSDGGDLAVGFWLDTPVHEDESVYLYFDAVNLADEPPRGTLSIDATDFEVPSCVSTESLVTIPLDELGLASSWQTFCVGFGPEAEFSVFGPHVTGESFHVGLDTFRFGPPCR